MEMKERDVNNMDECYTEEELSLVDLFGIFYKHRKKITLSVAVMTLVFFVVSLLIPPKYKISTTLELGLILDSKNQYSPIESGESIRSKIKVLTEKILNSEDQLNEKIGLETNAININVPKGRNIVEISVKAPEENVDEVLNFMDSLNKQIIQQHNRIFDQIKGDLLYEIKEKELQIKKKDLEIEDLRSKIAEIRMNYKTLMNEELNKIKALQNRINDIENEKETQEKKIALLNGEKKDLMKRVEEAEKEYQYLLKAKFEANKSAKAADAIGMLLYSNELLQMRNYLSKLRDRLLLEIPKEISALELSIEKLNSSLKDVKASKELEEIKLEQMEPKMKEEMAEVERAIKTKELEKNVIISEINVLKGQIDNMVATQVLLQPYKSEKPVAPNKKLIMAVGFVLSVFLAIFLAFIVEFWESNKDRIKSYNVTR